MRTTQPLPASRLAAIAAVGFAVWSQWLCGQTEPATTYPSTAPTSARSHRSSKLESPFTAPIAELTKEISDTIKSSDAPTRLQPDYFKDHPLPEDVTQEQLASAIATVPRSSDPRIQAYVQWQMLSGMPDTVEGRAAATLLRLYQSLPRPITRPGLDLQEQQRLTRVAALAGQAKESELSTQLTQAVDDTAALNRFNLNLRDALFARLPKTYDTLAAGFDDAIVRLETGADAEEHAEVVCDAVKQWAGEKRSSAELQAMNRLILKVKNQRGPEYFEQAEWKPTTRRLEWTRHRPNLNKGRQLDELADEIYTQSRQPKRS